MTVYLHEMKRGLLSLIIWAAAISSMIFVCMLIYPEMSDNVSSVEQLYSSLGSFTKAFGMDKISFATLMGFYGIEAGNMIGIGAVLYAAILGASMLSKEEHEHTAEFLMTHPISRKKLIAEKLFAAVSMLLILNIIIYAVSLASFAVINEKPEMDVLAKYLTAQFVMQLEVMSICFAFSSFGKRGSTGIGIGFAALMYFLSIIMNISDKADFLKYITPYKYADAADIISKNTIDGKLMCLGGAYTLTALCIAYFKYRKKDIAA